MSDPIVNENIRAKFVNSVLKLVKLVMEEETTSYHSMNYFMDGASEETIEYIHDFLGGLTRVINNSGNSKYVMTWVFTERKLSHSNFHVSIEERDIDNTVEDAVKFIDWWMTKK